MTELYRYVASPHRTWIIDTHTELRGMEIVCQVFKIRRRTPCGVWIFDHIVYRERWVNLTSRKAFAYPTKELALNSFKIRNSKRIGYLKSDLEEAELAYKAARTPELIIDEPTFMMLPFKSAQS